MRHSNAPQNTAVDPGRRVTKTEARHHCSEQHFTNSCTVPSRGASGNRNKQENIKKK